MSGLRKTEIQPMSTFRDNGLLWYINRVAFHPRGFALAFDTDDDGNITGWQVWGNGDEPWQYSPEVDENASFTAIEALLLGLTVKPEATNEAFER